MFARISPERTGSERLGAPHRARGGTSPLAGADRRVLDGRARKLGRRKHAPQRVPDRRSHRRVGDWSSLRSLTPSRPNRVWPDDPSAFGVGAELPKVRRISQGPEDAAIVSQVCEIDIRRGSIVEPNMHDVIGHRLCLDQQWSAAQGLIVDDLPKRLDRFQRLESTARAQFARSSSRCAFAPSVRSGSRRDTSRR